MRDDFARMALASRYQTNMARFASIHFLVFFLIIATGCSNKTQPVPTSGRVTIDGAPVGANNYTTRPAKISFLPIKSREGITLHPAMSLLDREGKYKLSTFKAGDGVLPGEYNVVIISLLSGPSIADPNAPEILEIPKYYGIPGQSGLTVTIPDQRTPFTVDFELKR